MPIEFRCTECNGLLRTPDGTSGKQAQCPQCSAVMTIPGAGPPESGPQVAAQGTAPPPYVSDTPIGGVPFGAGPSASQPLDPNNPYQSPPVVQTTGTTRGADGPAWERERKSPVSFVKTAVEAFGNPARFFGTMRRQGGIGAPLAFAVLGSIIGSSMFMLTYVPFALVTGMLENDLNMGREEFTIGVSCCLFMAPFTQVAFLFLATGTHHLLLNLVAGADYRFELTFRVVAYSSGIACLTGMIPLCGQYMVGITYVVIACLGLCYAHRASVGQVVVAGLLPAFLCGGAAIAGQVALVLINLPV